MEPLSERTLPGQRAGVVFSGHGGGITPQTPPPRNAARRDRLGAVGPVLEVLVSVAVGVALAAACGFRVFVPLLALSAAAYSGHLALRPGFEWMGSGAALLAFAVATAVEIAAYEFPWLDNALDTLATPAALVAGMVAAAAVVGDLPPLVRWAIVLVGGGGAAGVVQGATVLARLKSTALTGGLGNPILALAELAAAVFTSALALLAPVLAVLAVAVVCLVVFVRAGRFLFGRRPAS